MFLFEGEQTYGVYNDDWASTYYKWFYSPDIYFKHYLNDDSWDYDAETKKESPLSGCFLVSKKYNKNHNNKDCRVLYVNKSDLFSETFPPEAFNYALQKLKNYGSSVTITKAEKYKNLNGLMNGLIEFHYEPSEDRERWIKNRQHYFDLLNSEIAYNVTHPTYEQWLYMLNAYIEKKNPNMIFNKKKVAYVDLASKALIANYLKWESAKQAIHSALYDCKVNKSLDVEMDYMFIPFVYEAESTFEPDQEMLELIDDMLSSNKNKTKKEIALDCLPIAKMLDDNELVSSYEYSYEFSHKFYVKCSNENSGIIAISKPSTYYSIYVKPDGYKTYEKTNVGSNLKKADLTIEAAVRAIYKNDPTEIHKIVIKIR